MTETTQDEYARALGKEVAIGSVDKELRQLWEEDKASTNASLVNLAVYSEAEGAILRNSEIVQAITREHACRAILIGIDRDAPEASIRAWITAHCHLSQQGSKSVCCEQLAFQLTGKATGRLRNTVFAHLNSDLPLVFWWQGELSPIFSERLYSLIDRFVFDSSEWSQPLESFQKINQVMEESDELYPLDLEWTRSYPMRLALAGLFDDPLAAQALEHFNQIRIVVHPDHAMAGLQILAWLVDSTGWQRSQELGLCGETSPESSQGYCFHFETNEGSNVTATVECDASSAQIGLVELSGADCTVRVLRNAGSSYQHQQLEAGDHQIDQLMPAASTDACELVADQLSRGGKNTLYRTMMPLFLDLLACQGG
ncbi:glucose-6-phosphate dehydrogenase assembly protein OpcA [Verrucomicrobiaceae bacterium R5-34]|uniref:Glucose-6-phosphate dehydrogenase assembly protein OpcA n=1 Tax=Oceaniferula flava TaxID=2800421 RepID=A0AAE2V982_9BACT|nr:glucose-6-phosphate dehydrogenase assembly protein OpcA [Oceaniferula flavus]MBK1830557.1 glucose-6-phosphate dehydrogenase assembly protein OpcA [Verrucomicrobiaceae bacterium R5-34]MBK1854653.1 glucose-6-phosphate dehydrogenase assembly protein OpcA [Oceaniferula flavus]MBM1135959.1 glucose-6-phosphate dehydrogenase assembly protein OpcA [Oceaniferula flavus]